MPVLGIDQTTGEAVELTPRARRQGVYVIGTTGTGKTTLLQNIAYQDMLAGDGLCVLDPHGDFIDELLARVPRERVDDVILFAPGEPEQYQRPLGLNLLACDRDDPKQRDRVSSTVISTLYKLFSYSWGPRMEDLLRHSILTLLESEGTTLLELLLLLASEEHRAEFTQQVADPILQHFWEVQFAAYDRRMRVEVVGSSLNKIGRFLANPVMRNIIAQRENAFDMRSLMDEGKILLVNLSKGDLGEDNSALLGAVLVNLVLIAALQRREVPPEHRRPFHLIVDEYQSFATESFPTLQSEARKYALDVIVAHQYRDQLDELNKGSTLNVANFIVLRVSGIDGFELASQFDNTPPEPEKVMQPLYREYRSDGQGEPLYTIHQLTTGAGSLFREVDAPQRLFSDVHAERANQLAILANFEAQCRLVDQREMREFEIETLRPQGEPDERVAEYVRQRSISLGRDREEVEKEISERVGQLEFMDIPAYEYRSGGG